MIKKLMLCRIEAIRLCEQGFNKNTMRWKSFVIGDKHISEVDFEGLDDDALLYLFERIIKRHNAQG